MIEVSGQPPFWCGDNVSIQRPLKLVLTVKIWRNQISTDRSDFSSIERLDISRTDKIIQSMIFAFRILHTNFHCCLKTKQLYLWEYKSHINTSCFSYYIWCGGWWHSSNPNTNVCFSAERRVFVIGCYWDNQIKYCTNNRIARIV